MVIPHPTVTPLFILHEPLGVLFFPVSILSWEGVSSIFRKLCLHSSSCSLLCKALWFQVLFGLLSCFPRAGADLQPLWHLFLSGAGRLHLESPCPDLSPQNKKDTNKIEQGPLGRWPSRQSGSWSAECKRKGWETGFFQPEEEQAKVDFTGVFTWLKEFIGKMEPRSSQRCTMSGPEAKDTSCSRKKSSS